MQIQHLIVQIDHQRMLIFKRPIKFKRRFCNEEMYVLSAVYLVKWC